MRLADYRVVFIFIFLYSELLVSKVKLDFVMKVSSDIFLVAIIAR